MKPLLFLTIIVAFSACTPKKPSPSTPTEVLRTYFEATLRKDTSEIVALSTPERVEHMRPQFPRFLRAKLPIVRYYFHGEKADSTNPDHTFVRFSTVVEDTTNHLSDSNTMLMSMHKVRGVWKVGNPQELEAINN